MEITGKFIALYVYIKKEKRLKINELAFTLREKKTPIEKTQRKLKSRCKDKSKNL